MSKITKSAYKPEIDKMIAEEKGAWLIQKFLKKHGENVSRPTIQKYIAVRQRALVRAKSTELVPGEAIKPENLRHALLYEIDEIRKIIAEGRSTGGHISSEKSLRDFYETLCNLIRLYNQMVGQREKKEDISIVLSRMHAEGRKIDFAALKAEMTRDTPLPLPEEPSGDQKDKDLENRTDGEDRG